MYDLITEYFPDIEELTPAQLQAARAGVVNYMRPHFPTHDLSPGSVFGDMYVSPAAAWLAAITVAQNRFMSDLDLANVANGTIYSCAFVERYLGNFAVKDVTTLQSSGLVRLTFSADADYSINKGVKFQFGSTDLFYPRLPSPDTDHFRILPAGTLPVTSLNEVALVQTSLTTWAVDLPLTGKMTADVSRGATGLASITMPELVGITAAVSFDYGLPPVSLPMLAEMARDTAYAASVGSRNSTRAFVRQQWPETKVVSVVATGDIEMQRTAAGSPIILQAPATDVYFRSRRDSQEESQIVRLDYHAELRLFRGKVGFLHRPNVITDVVFAGDSERNHDPAVIYSRVVTVRLPGSTGCGTTYEEFWIEVTPHAADPVPPEELGVLLLPRAKDANDVDYGMFEVSYLTDPLLEPVSAMLTSPEHAPVGVDVAVKAGPLVEVTSLTVNYRRKPGTTMALDVARAEITAYVNGVGWPELFSEAAMIETMYAAGALRTDSIDYVARLTVTPAHRRFEKGFDPDTDPDWNASGSSLACLAAVITTVSGMRPSLVVDSEVNGVAEMYVVSPRNVRYYLKADAITFNEL